jgi:hypothetical protein
VTRPLRPAKPDFTPRERRLIARLRTPDAVQGFLNALPYNTEPPPDRPTLRTFRGVVERHTAHCLEAALTAAVILEQHGFPPMLMSLESIDELDHVVFVYRREGRWGSVARSRDPGLHGRKPVFPTLERLARSYFDPYIDREGCIKAYGATDLGVLDGYDWRLSRGNVWKVERLLYAIPHAPLRYSTRRAEALRRRYVRYIESFGRKPLYYNRRAWSALPAEYANRLRRGQV